MRFSDLAPGLVLGEGVRIGEGVQLGAHVVIHAGTHVGDGCVIQDGAVVGKLPRLGPRSSATTGELPPARLEPGAAVCCGAVVMRGAVIAKGAVVGDHAYVRERASLGEDSVLGQAGAIGADARVGARVRIQNTSKLVAAALVEDEVFIGPSVTATNDLTMGRRAPGAPLAPITLRRGCRIGAGVILMPGVEVGEDAVVGAAALVTRDVPPATVVIGAPARHLRELRPEELLER